MKTLHAVLTLLVIILFTGCNNDDDNNTGNRTGEKIEALTDGITTLDFSNVIVAKDNPLDPSTGFTNIFTITSQDTAGNPFEFKFEPSTISPFIVTTPSSEVLPAPLSNRLTIHGLDFEDAGPNNITVTYISFGPNVGDAIKINISGTYFLVTDALSHSINCDIDILRD